MRKIMLLVSFFIMSCDNKSEVLVYQLNEVIFAVYKNKMFQYSKYFGPEEVFLENSKNKYCGSSWNLNCMDSNRHSYQVCMEMEQISKSKFKFLCSDTCTLNYLKRKGNELTLISNKEMKILWDSIVVSYHDYPSIKKVILPNSLSDYRLHHNHPFTLDQEVYLIVKKGFKPYTSESTNDDSVTLSIYNDGKVISREIGNLFPRILININSQI